MSDVLKFRGEGRISALASNPTAASWRVGSPLEADSPPVSSEERKYPGWVRLAILLGSSALLWWGIIRVGSAVLSAG